LADAGRLPEAAQACEEALRTQSASAEGYYLLALVQDALGETEQAAKSYRKVLFLEPGHAEAAAHLSLLAGRQGDVARPNDYSTERRI